MLQTTRLTKNCTGPILAGSQACPAADLPSGLPLSGLPDHMYLLTLADRIARGLGRIPDVELQPHREFILSQQTVSGGFRGREGDADLYYTGFAVRALAVTGGLPDESRDLLSSFLQQQDPAACGTIDLLSWLYSAAVVQAAGGKDLLSSQPADLVDNLIAGQLTLRRHDGGFAKASDGALGSTYHSFLVALVLELLGRSLPRPNALAQFLFDRQRDDGGFVEIAPMKRSGTNPTAAAVAVLRTMNLVDAETREDVLGFLGDVISTEGGFQANTRIEFADGLSTFTGLLTAQDLAAADLLPLARVLKYVRSQLEISAGGFRGASWDQQADVEYTFYGLGILGLIFSANP